MLRYVTLHYIFQLALYRAHACLYTRQCTSATANTVPAYHVLHPVCTEQ